MVFANRKQYYTYDSDSESASFDSAAASTSEVIYTPERVRELLESPSPIVLLMARGKELSQAVTEAKLAEMRPVAAQTGSDTALAGRVRLKDDESVRLGDSYSDELYSNAHAVLQAAQACSADAVLLCGQSKDLASVDAFLSRAESQGIAVFSRQGDARSSLGWIKCETHRKASDSDSWLQCPKCTLRFDKHSMKKCSYKCPACGAYFRLTSDQRILEVLDKDSFEAWDEPCEETNPLQFPGYLDKLESLHAKTGFDEAVKTGAGRIGSIRTAIAVMESEFLMGSMGSVVGERLSNMFDRATEEGIPVVVFCASGGARMQEGLVSLMQMAKISCAVKRHSDAGLLYVSVLTDPTTGGVTASFAMQGDIILAEPNALIGFAGRRVIQDTIRQELPEDFQTAEFMLKHGLVDAVVPRDQLRMTLANLLALHHAHESSGDGEQTVIEFSNFNTVLANLEDNSRTRNRVTFDLPEYVVRLHDDVVRKRGAVDHALRRFKNLKAQRDVINTGYHAPTPNRTGTRAGETYLPVAKAGELGLETTAFPQQAPPSSYPFTVEDRENAAWKSVQIARNTHRPTSAYYLDHLLDGFIELHGDRAFGDDAAIIAGIGWMGSTPVTVIAQEKGSTVKERLKRNFGCPQPEGYRKSLRLMRQAEKFGRPIVCLVDTQGAFCGMEAEERGQGNAIADNLAEMAGLRVPIVSVLLGEGGSGGALALALANRVGMLEHAVYSVLSPEGFASILWKDRTRAAEAAAIMKMDASQVHDMGIVDDVIAEGDAPAHENPEQAAENVSSYIREALQGFVGFDADELVNQRQSRFAQY